MKKILFILFTVQSVLAPHITKSYSVNSIEDSYEYSIVNQEKKTVKKDILGNTIIEDLFRIYNRLLLNILYVINQKYGLNL